MSQRTHGTRAERSNGGEEDDIRAIRFEFRSAGGAAVEADSGHVVGLVAGEREVTRGDRADDALGRELIQAVEWVDDIVVDGEGGPVEVGASQAWQSFRPAPFPASANTLDSFIQGAVYWFVVAENTPLPEAIDVGLSPELPVPLGDSLRTADDWEVTFLSVDVNATAAVLAMDPSNTAPPVGHVYVLARVHASWRGMGETARTTSNAFQGWARFQMVADDGPNRTTYDPSCGTLEFPLEDFSVLNGESLNGYLCWVVPDALTATGVLVDDTLIGDGDDLRWFAIR